MCIQDSDGDDWRARGAGGGWRQALVSGGGVGHEADDDGDWDEGDDAELRQALKSLVGNKLNMAHKQLRQQMSNG